MTGVLELPKTEPAIKPKNGGEPRRFRWTRKDYYRLGDLGFFEGKRVELIEGEIVEMSPMKQAHATAIGLLIEALGKIFAKNYVVRTQLPMSFSGVSEPEPDVAVVKGKIRDFSQSHPKTAELIIEVSDMTQQNDRTKKAGLYAKNKIEDYWILNLKNRCLEIYRRPIRDKKLGFVYTEIQILTETETASPLAKLDAKIKVADLLP